MPALEYIILDISTKGNAPGGKNTPLAVMSRKPSQVNLAMHKKLRLRLWKYIFKSIALIFYLHGNPVPCAFAHNRKGATGTPLTRLFFRNPRGVKLSLFSKREYPQGEGVHGHIAKRLAMGNLIDWHPLTRFAYRNPRGVTKATLRATYCCKTRDGEI